MAVGQFSPNARFYSIGVQDAVSKQWRELKQLPSVTTILKFASNEALAPWASNVTIEGVAKLLEQGLVKAGATANEIKAALKEARLRHYDIRDDAGDRGTITHDFVEELHAFGTDGLDLDELDPWKQGLAKWWSKYRPKVLLKEIPVACLSGGWAGRIDLVAQLHGQNSLALVDFKTVKDVTYFKRFPFAYDSNRVQLAVYREALLEENPDLDIRHLLVVRVAGGTFHQYSVPDTEWQPAVDYFKGCLKIYEYRKFAA